jgi:16S rRNA (guanine1516-N2)-methyltransferase
MAGILRRSGERLELHIAGQKPLYTDFSVQTWQHRRDAGKSQVLIKAIKPKPGMRIIDATAGWGRDAAVLAAFGAQVLMLERNNIMVELLQNGLLRQSEHDKKILRLQLVAIDALQYLQTISAQKSISAQNYPDLIYIDPMHPEKKSGIKVKKDLQALQSIIGAEPDAGKLLQIARSIAPVIVKWPLHAPPLAADVLHSWRGKTIRMDKFMLLQSQSEYY